MMGGAAYRAGLAFFQCFRQNAGLFAEIGALHFVQPVGSGLVLTDDPVQGIPVFFQVGAILTVFFQFGCQLFEALLFFLSLLYFVLVPFQLRSGIAEG